MGKWIEKGGKIVGMRMGDTVWTLELDRAYPVAGGKVSHYYRIERETEKAVGLTRDVASRSKRLGWLEGRSWVWLPKSQIQILGNKIEMPKWLKKKNFPNEE